MPAYMNLSPGMDKVLFTMHFVVMRDAVCVIVISVYSSLSSPTVTLTLRIFLWAQAGYYVGVYHLIILWHCLAHDEMDGVSAIVPTPCARPPKSFISAHF